MECDSIRRAPQTHAAPRLSRAIVKGIRCNACELDSESVFFTANTETPVDGVSGFVGSMAGCRRAFDQTWRPSEIEPAA